MTKQKTKLGARILSQAELNAILPNADSVYEQIEVFRNNAPEKRSDSEKEKKKTWEQKTNNIGIMGRRGAGKTSILRTFHDGLERKNDKNDIILPIIIPENMSADTSLMDVVLGMLKSEVENKKKKRKKEALYGEDCIYSGRDELEKDYNKLVKQYCYIKKDYRDILIQQFTTEQNYVDKTTQVFNSDTEFIRLFDTFIETLVYDGVKSDAKPMIFLFIDDIDLSTTRCMDVVRTLLSYLSNPRIVTFISGDMVTFEEALTLEFLRQEKALNKEIFDENYYNVTDSDDVQQEKAKLLERKKTLAYEYLKKIIPPAYRKSIKYWSLEERGNYLVESESKAERNDAEKADKETKAPKLAELLKAVTESRLDKAYFSYEKGNDLKYMSVTFHMFDDTSRGLNNVYNVLQEINNTKKSENGSALIFWRLIETIIDSKLIYAKYKEALQKNIIVLEGDRVRVNFDNAIHLLDKLTPKIRFILFLLIDFTSRLFCCEQSEASGYTELKEKIIWEYLADETIDDKIPVSRDKEEKKEEKKERKKEDLFKTDIQKILTGLLEKSDFLFALYLIKFLGREDINHILKPEKSQIPASSSREQAYKIGYALAQVVRAIRETEEERKKYLADLYIQLQNEMTALLSKLALNPKVIYGGRLMEDTNPGFGRYNSYADCTWRDASTGHIESLMNTLRQNNFPDKNAVMRLEYINESLCYSIYYSMLLDRYGEKEHKFNIAEMSERSSYNGAAAAIMKKMQGAMDQYKVKKLKDAGYKIPEGGNEKTEKKENQEKQVIALIDEKDMWATPYAKSSIYTYLRKKKNEYINQMSGGRLIFEASELFGANGAYSALDKCDKGTSGTALAYNLMRQVQNILFLSEEKRTEEMFSDGKYYLSLEQVLTLQCLLDGFLRSHPRIRYAKKEARQLSMKIGEIPLVIRTNEWGDICDEIEKREEKFYNYVFKELISYSPEKHSLHDRVAALVGGNSGLDNIADSVYTQWRGKGNILQVLEENRDRYGELLKEGKAAEADYFQYYIQQIVITLMKRDFPPMDDNQNSWEKMEPVIPEEDYKFIFHSYLRYLQENDEDAGKAGARAEDIAKLAEYMMDSEVIADRRMQNEIYEIVNKELHITEDDFEKLFIR